MGGGVTSLGTLQGFLRLVLALWPLLLPRPLAAGSVLPAEWSFLCSFPPLCKPGVACPSLPDMLCTSSPGKQRKLRWDM